MPGENMSYTFTDSHSFAPVNCASSDSANIRLKYPERLSLLKSTDSTVLSQVIHYNSSCMEFKSSGEICSF